MIYDSPNKTWGLFNKIIPTNKVFHLFMPWHQNLLLSLLPLKMEWVFAVPCHSTAHFCGFTIFRNIFWEQDGRQKKFGFGTPEKHIFVHSP